MIGEVLGNRYELVEKIGEGGMAIVYKARDNKLSRLVAVKVLKKEFANNKDISDKFKKEATAVANFSDANIVNVLDVGHEEEEDIDYFVMEYVNGKTLKELIVGSGKLNYTTAISIAIQIAKALECAHKNNIIHRDVKPQNILVTESGLIKVTDFGIAKSSTSATITNTTTIMGSAHYLSPEQAKGSFVDLRSDIYSLGVVLYEMVTGVLPFDGESPVTIALKHIQSEPIEPKKQNQAIPDSLNNLIMKCMSKECINRYQNCKELIDDLQKIKENPNVSIGTVENYDDGKTIIMEPIRVEDFVKNESSKNTSEESKNKIYTRDDFENDYDDDEDDDKPSARKKLFSGSKKSDDEDTSTSFTMSDKPKNSRGKVVPIKQTARGLEVVVIRPESMEDASEITDTLLSGKAVVLNLEGIHVEIAQRIIDYSAGSCYSIRGNLQKITNYIFLVTPPNVDISGDIPEIVAGGIDLTSFKNDTKF